jgi:hypothetical protein
MVSPINYMLDVRNPIEEALRGYSLGRADIEQRQQMQEREQMMGLRQAQESRAASQFEQQRAATAAAQERAEAMRAALVGLAENPGATAEDYGRLMMQYPEISQDLQRGWNMISEPRQQTLLREMAQIYSAIDTDNIDIARNLLNERIEASRNSGREEDARQAEFILQTMEVDPRVAKTTLGISLRALGGSAFDGLLTGGRTPIRSSQILDDGTVVAVTDEGPKVFSPSGEELTGQAAAEAIRQAQEFGVDIQAARAGERTAATLQARADLGATATGAEEAGRSGIELSNATFAAIGPIQSNIGNLDRAIELVEQEGANTGVLASRLPAWRASTIELRNLQNQLGIDVIGSVTFGALSEGELRLALETALPTNLQEDALADWLRRKRDAQQKLVDNLSMRAEFTAIPGNTPGRWMQFTRSGGETFEDMYQWMADNPIRTRGGGQPAGEQPRGERPEILEEQQFIADMNAKINAGETLTPEEIARLNRIAGQ